MNRLWTLMSWIVNDGATWQEVKAAFTPQTTFFKREESP